jgi:uncharacterized protein YcbK (DUF882 family)
VQQSKQSYKQSKTVAAVDTGTLREMLKGERKKEHSDVECRALFQMFRVQEQFRGPSDIVDVYQGPRSIACWATL